ncbi:DUF2157 domain-containing protein [Patescibacteria group bacterium]|nr:DUF2157 domain-containing protein [Patescibacteria group bacterium]
MKGISALEAIEVWQKEGVLTPEQAKLLKDSLQKKSGDIGVGHGIVIFSTIGAVLVALGVLLFIGSNWQNMGPTLRILVVFTGYIVVDLGAYATQKRGLEKVPESLWFLLSLMLGAAIFLLAQIFHHSLTFWQGPLLWMFGVLAMGFARKLEPYAFFAIPLGLLALGWFGGGGGWFMDDQMQFLVDERGLRPLLPLIGIGLIALGTVVRDRVTWAEDSLFKWGTLLIAIPLIATTVHQEIASWFFETVFTLKQLLILGGVFFVIAISLVKGKMHSDISKIALLGVAAFLVLPTLHVGGEPLVGAAIKDNLVLFLMHILVVFGISLLSVWFGIRTANRGLVNTGILAASVIILIQYFSWSFEMLHSSIAFILGGIVLIALSIFMERTRKKLLASIHTS